MRLQPTACQSCIQSRQRVWRYAAQSKSWAFEGPSRTIGALRGSKGATGEKGFLVASLQVLVPDTDQVKVFQRPLGLLTWPPVAPREAVNMRLKVNVTWIPKKRVSQLEMIPLTGDGSCFGLVLVWFGDSSLTCDLLKQGVCLHCFGFDSLLLVEMRVLWIVGRVYKEKNEPR